MDIETTAEDLKQRIDHAVRPDIASKEEARDVYRDIEAHASAAADALDEEIDD